MIEDNIAIAKALPQLSAEGEERLARAMAHIDRTLDDLNYADEAAKRDELLALA